MMGGLDMDSLVVLLDPLDGHIDVFFCQLCGSLVQRVSLFCLSRALPRCLRSMWSGDH